VSSGADFDLWIDFVFNHPVTDPSWYWSSEPFEHAWHDQEPTPSTMVAYLTRLFEAPEFLFEQFSKDQIGEGLNLLINIACSGDITLFNDESVPWEERKRGFRSILSLYQRAFAPHCSNGTKGSNPKLEWICFMFWDVVALGHTLKNPDEQREREAIVFSVLEQTLDLPSLACQEAALHGLAHHCFGGRREQVSAIVDRWLARQTDLLEWLRDYALAARVGAVQ
jgi:hypothetical protein